MGENKTYLKPPPRLSMTNQPNAVWCQPLAPPLKEVHLVPPGCWVEPLVDHKWNMTDFMSGSATGAKAVQTRRPRIHGLPGWKSAVKKKWRSRETKFIFWGVSKWTWFDGRKEGSPRSFCRHEIFETCPMSNVMSPLSRVYTWGLPYQSVPKAMLNQIQGSFPRIGKWCRTVRLVVIKLAHVFNWTVFAGRLLDYTPTWMISWAAGKLQLEF